jgi:hypothetical protein
LAAFARVLVEVCAERDASHGRADVVQWDFSPRHMPPVPSTNSSPTLAGRWRNA